MNLNNFNKEELEIIESLLQSSHKINSIYERLYQLDINNQKNSKEYLNLIKELKEEIIIENKKYKKFNLTIEQQTKIMELISTNSNSKTIDSPSTIINEYDNNLITRRIFNILANQTITNIDYTKIIVEKELPELLNTIGLSTDDKTYNELTNYSIIQIAINNDITSTFLVILQETLNLWKYSKYKNNLLKAIYSTSFIYKDIEKELIDKHFNIPNNIYISSKLVNDLLKSNSNIYDMITTLLIEPQIEKHIINLLEIKDNEYTNPNINISSILTECYIRSLLTFLNEDRIKHLNNQFLYLISNPTYLKKYPNNRISIDIITNCFKNIKYDKSKKRTISFGFK